MKQNKWRKVTCEIQVSDIQVSDVQVSDVQVPLYILDGTRSLVWYVTL